MPVSISDVARRAEVSITTVSHALSGKRPVSDDAKQRITRAIAELDYVPGASARNLREGRTRMIALIVPEIGNHFFGQLARGAEDAANARDHGLVLCNSGGSPQRERRYLELLRGRTVDGVVYVAGSYAPPGGQLQAAAGRHEVVLADEFTPGLDGIPLVTADNLSGGRMIGELFRELGHEHALVITGPRGLRSVEDRLRGFAAVYPQAVVREGDFTEAAGERLVIEALESGIPFTAVFALNDLMAIGVLNALAGRGVAVPDELSVAGFDDIGSAALVRPTLTTVRQPAEEIGREAIALLIDRLHGERLDAPDAEVLPVRLMRRGSTGPAPARAAAPPAAASPVTPAAPSAAPPPTRGPRA